MPARLTWRGPEIAAKAAVASMLAVDKTMANCVAHAKADHPAYPPASLPYERFAHRTAFMDASLTILDAASLDGDMVSGRWGSLANYALFLEIGTSIAGPTAVDRAAAAGGNMDAITLPIGPLMAPRPWARPAMDTEYPLLALRVGAAFRGERLP